MPKKLASQELDASVEASGPHDFTVREIRALVRSAPRVHRILLPTFVTIAKRPSWERDGEGYRFDLGQAGTKKILQRGLDRWNQVDWLQQIRRGAQVPEASSGSTAPMGDDRCSFAVGDGMTASGAMGEIRQGAGVSYVSKGGHGRLFAPKFCTWLTVEIIRPDFGTEFLIYAPDRSMSVVRGGTDSRQLQRNFRF